MDLIQRLMRSRTVPKFHHRVADDHVLDESFAASILEPEKHYFEIRLSEMYLRDRREYLRRFVPFSVVVSDFLYDGGKQVVPFLVGNQLLPAFEKELEGEYVEFLDTRVAGPAPYMGDDVGLYVGLFRAQAADLARTLFNMLQGVVKAFDTAQISTYLQVAEPLGEGLAQLLGMEEVEARLGRRVEFGARPDANHPFRSGYLAYVNCPEQDVTPERLWIREGRLFLGRDRHDLRPFRDHDFCLVRIRHDDKRRDYNKLPFARYEKEAKRLVAQDKRAEAEIVMGMLRDQLAVSPDFVELDRFDLQLVFQANFSRAVEHYAKLRTGKPAARAGRRGAGAASAIAMLDGAARTAEDLGYGKDVKEALLDLKHKWGTIPYLACDPETFELTDEALNEQLVAVRNMRSIARPDSRALAETLAVHAVQG